MKKRKKVVRSGFQRSPAHQSQNRLLQETNAYVMANLPFFWKSKFGITDKVGARRRNVSETTPGYVFTIFAANLAFGWHCEQWVHFFYSWLNRPFRNGSGRSEWFLVVNPVVGTLFLWGSVSWFGVVFDWRAYALVYFFPLVWLDALFWLLVFRGLKVLFVAIVVLGLAYFLAHCPA